ncbi:TolC family protein [Campylobacter sp. MIT 99-7217]|uniref:TolC family protein n=1 Tax=Campylobacter sp. MIT 99-7217 TaxID=535091 RepID=UPI0011593DB9|nr:TolC family protein [Campylobacter sp. MIT 99-7217]TQR31851.1 TolC family protein [Campylobacter sp. MIT 99-7217]
MKKILAFLFPLSLLANSNLTTLIDLSLNNEEYLTAELYTEQANKQSLLSYAAYLPELSLQSAYVSNDKDRFITDPRESAFAKFNLKLILYDGGKREARIRYYKEALELAKLNKELRKNYLALNATTLFFNYQSLQNLIFSSEQKEKFLADTLKRIQDFYEVGLSSKEELQSIKAKYHLVHLELSQNKLKKLEIQKELQKLSKQSFTPEGEASLQDPKQEQSKSLEVSIAKRQVNFAKASFDQVKSSYIPTFFIQDSYTFYKNRYALDMPPILSPVLDPYLNQYMPKKAQSNQFIIGLEWRFFGFFERRQKFEAERIEMQIQKLNFDYKERQNKLELEYKFKELEVLKEQVNALELALEAANLAFESINTKYSTGLSSYNDYLKALDDKFKANADLELAKNQLEIAKAEYYFTAGIDIKERIKK